MIYYRTKNEYIEKQEVILDREQLEKLRMQIIENCSKIVHFISENLEDNMNYMHVKNFSKVLIKVRKNYDFYPRDESIYLYSYDKYIEPYLAILIDKLLKGDLSAIEQIENYDLEINFKNEMKARINYLIFQIKQLEEKKANSMDSSSDIDESLSISIKKLEKLEKELELNRNQKSVNEYYEKVIKCISFKTIDKKKISDIVEIQEFLNEYSDRNVATNIRKIFVNK